MTKPRWLPTLLDDARLAALLRTDVGATSVYLLLAAKHSLGLPEGCTCSTNELRRWIAAACGRKPSWAQTDRAVRDLVISGVVERVEGPGQSYRYRLSGIHDSEDPEFRRTRVLRSGFGDPGNGSRKPENPSTISRREERGSHKASSLSSLADTTDPAPDSADDSAEGSVADSGRATGDDARDSSLPADGLPGDDARRRALADPRLAAVVDSLSPADPPEPLEGEALEAAKRAAREGTER